MKAHGPPAEAPSGPTSPDMSGPARYLTLGSFQSDEVVIKRSRFIGWGVPVASEEEALAVLDRIRSKHPQATHHCYAYRVGLGAETIRFHDDGEPAGTAGRPILEVLQREGLQNCLAVVTRYYGGTPLGAAGLVRAYAQSAKLAVDAARVVENVLHTRLRCDTDYESIGRVQHALQQRNVVVEEIDYAERVTLYVVVQCGREDEIRAVLSELTNGQAEVTELTRLYRSLKPGNGG